MEKFAEKLMIKLPLWKIFLGALVIFTTFLYGMFKLFENIKGEEFYSFLGALTFGAIVSAGIVGMINLARAGFKFYKEADEIEEMIRNGEPQDEVVKSLYDLQKKSFHRTTGEKVTQLAKMAEIKYDIKLLKR